jgi:predicted RNase H-like HicB family nuclease/DNA-binding XRE family transcriptional regulator
MQHFAYPIRFEPADEGGYCVQGLPPMEGVISDGETLDEAKDMAKDALTGVLATLLDHNLPIPRPVPAEGPDVYAISPDSHVAIAVLLRWAREDAGLTQGEVAQRLGIKQPSYQRLEKPDANPSIQTIARAFKAIGRELHLAI